jgi:hypothetical protein
LGVGQLIIYIKPCPCAEAGTRIQKENILKLQKILQVTISAALVAMCVTIASLFAVQSVAGQYTRILRSHGVGAAEYYKQEGLPESDESADEQPGSSVALSPCPLRLSPSILSDGAVDKDYSEQLMAAGGVEPHSFEVQGTLPPGLSLSPEGLLSGTPTLDGRFEFRVLVTDAMGCAKAFDTSITIEKE